MKVQRIWIGENVFNFILIGDDYRPIDYVTQYMKYLYSIGKTMDTRHTYCIGLKYFYEYLGIMGINVTEVRIKHLSNYIVWLRHGDLKNLGPPIRTERTVNLYMKIALGFLKTLYLLGIETEDKTIGVYADVSGKYNPFKDFLYHVSKNTTFTRNQLTLKPPKEHVSPLTKEQLYLLYDSTSNCRDLFLLHLLLHTGIRIGEVLGLFHEDIIQSDEVFKLIIRNRLGKINQSSAKTGYREVFMSRELIDLYDDYCFFTECELEQTSDYVFIKICGPKAGMPMEKHDVYSLFRRLKKKTGIDVFPHLFRRTYATTTYVASNNIEYVRKTLGHSNVQTTVNSYVFPSEEQKVEEWKKVQAKIAERSKKSDTI